MGMGTKTILVVAVVAASAGICIALNAGAAGPAETRSVWDGVYTQKQAERGEDLYYHKCSSCHGDKLTGKESENAPALTGNEFEKQWNDRTVADLYRKILRKMPDDNPGELTPQQSADLVAYILSSNKFPAGKNELPPDNAPLSNIRFGKKP
jgi:cytochrome c